MKQDSCAPPRNPEEVVILPMARRHLGRVLQLEAETGLTRWSEVDYEAILAVPRLWLARVAKAAGMEPAPPIGFAVARVVAPEVELAKIAVDGAFQGRGVGKCLLRAILARAASIGCNTCHLEVRQSNEHAVRFYRSRGFAATGIRAGYYSAPVEDAILMKLELPAADKQTGFGEY